MNQIQWTIIQRVAPAYITTGDGTSKLEVSARGGKLYWHFVIRDAGKIFFHGCNLPQREKLNN